MNNKSIEKNELMEIVNDFSEIAVSNKFQNSYKDSKIFRKQVNNLMTLFNQFSKNLGVTEYSTIDQGYSGDQFLEKYKDDISNSWRGKKEKKNSIKKITQEEIIDSVDTYLERRNKLSRQREMHRIEEGQIPRKIEGHGKDNTLGISVYKYDEDQNYSSSSSENEDDVIIDNLLGIPNKKKKSTKKKIRKLTSEKNSQDEYDESKLQSYQQSILDSNSE